MHGAGTARRPGRRRTAIQMRPSWRASLWREKHTFRLPRRAVVRYEDISGNPAEPLSHLQTALELSWTPAYRACEIDVHSEHCARILEMAAGTHVAPNAKIGVQ